MFGTGLPEIVIILLVVLVLFGPAVLTFWLGYVIGQNRAAGEGATPEPDSSEKTVEDSEESIDE